VSATGEVCCPPTGRISCRRTPRSLELSTITERQLDAIAAELNEPSSNDARLDGTVQELQRARCNRRLSAGPELRYGPSERRSSPTETGTLQPNRSATTSVLYDDQIVKRQRAGGISRYFVEVAREFRAHPELGITVRGAWRRTTNIHALEAGIAAPIPGGQRLQVAAHLVQRAAMSAPIGRPQRSLQQTVDIIHHTYYHRHYLGRSSARVTASTVHDMIPELLPQLFPRGNPHLAKEDFVRRSQLVFVPSQATRLDLERLYGPLEAEIAVVPHGVGPPFTDAVDGSSPPVPDSGSYALYLGDRRGYKDFGVAVIAMHDAVQRSRWVPRRLVVVGGGQPDNAERKLVSSVRNELKIEFRSASDQELADLYRSARLFLFPSRYEGFGIPTLEAMASRCPVVLPRCSSHPEVAGDAGSYFAPQDPESCADAIIRLSEDEEYRKLRIEAGNAQVASFSWPASARLMAQAYEEAVISHRS